MTSDQDLLSTASFLGFEDDRFRFHGRRGNTKFACDTLEKIEAHFGHHIASRWWYADGDNSMPGYAVDYRNGDVFDAIRRIVPDCDETVWMTTRHIPEHIVSDARNPGHDVNLFEGSVAAICSILEESYGFEYFLVSPSHEWLVCENDHGIIIAVGKTVAERLRELGPPTASDGEITMGEPETSKTPPRDSYRYLASTMKRFPIILCMIVLTGVAVALVQQLRRDARTDNCRNNLRLVAILVRQYATEHGKLPKATTNDINGTALQSWRLSAIETREYFDFSLHMDASNPWTTPQNREFFKKFDDSIFACPSAASIDGITQYVAIVGDGTAWDTNTNVDDIRDQTLLIIEWPNSDIYWAEPRDITLDELSSMLTIEHFRSEHSDCLRYIDWSATVHEIPLDSSAFDTVQKLARVPAASNATQTPAK